MADVVNSELLEAASLLRRMFKQHETAVAKLKVEGALLQSAEKVVTTLEQAEKTRAGVQGQIDALTAQLEALKKSVASQTEKAAQEVAELHEKVKKANIEASDLLSKKEAERKKTLSDIDGIKALVEKEKVTLNKELDAVKKELVEKTALLDDIKKKLSTVASL